MKIGLANAKFVNFDIERNKNSIVDIIRNSNLDIVFFGESFLNGFDGLTWDVNRDIGSLEIMTTNNIEEIRQVCVGSSTGVGFGYFEIDDNKIYSSYIVIDKFGNDLVNYRRQSDGWKIPSSPSNYKEGNKIESFVLEGITFDVLLCGDAWDDKIYDKYGRSEFLLWPIYVTFDIHSDINEYVERVIKKYSNAIIIGSLSDNPDSGGGSFLIMDSKLIMSSSKSERTIIRYELLS